MSNSVLMLPPQGGQWTADPGEFADAARRRWPDAEMGGPFEHNGYDEVWIQTGTPLLDCTFALRADGTGYFSIRSGARPNAPEMFAWVREWLGPDNACVLLNTGSAESILEIPFGAGADQIADIVTAVAPR